MARGRVPRPGTVEYECVFANPRVFGQHRLRRLPQDASGKAALMRGPIVYCLEGVDNAFPITGAAVCAPLQAKVLDNCELGLPMIEATGTVPADTEAAPLYSPLDALPKDVPLRFIPYYAFANRGESDMRVWLPIQRS